MDDKKITVGCPTVLAEPITSKAYLVIGTRLLPFDAGFGAFIAIVDFDVNKSLEGQLREYARHNRVDLDRGLVAVEAAAAIGGPHGHGPV